MNTISRSPRGEVYYWKCDRPAAFHGTAVRLAPDPEMGARLRAALEERFGTRAVEIRPGRGQGNHVTWDAEIDGMPIFIRVEDGPEGDEHLAVESALLDHVRATGVPVPRVHASDVSRAAVPFAWQALERIEAPDLNTWFREGALEVPRVAFAMGAAVARWQALRPLGFGPVHDGRTLAAFHDRYGYYFHLRLESHLSFLTTRGFLEPPMRTAIERAIAAHAELLQLSDACLVHKDLALWNVLGSATEIAAFIDFDDAIGGDPLDDLSLLACFHDAPFLARAFAGYESERRLPEEHRRRFWLHFLRNMIVKSVIRVGAGYFERDDRFFLLGRGGTGAEFRRFTLERLALALRGLQTDATLDLL